MQSKPIPLFVFGSMCLVRDKCPRIEGTDRNVEYIYFSIDDWRPLGDGED